MTGTKTALFVDLVEKIRTLDIESKVYLVDWIQHLLVEEKREKIKKHARESLAEYRKGRVALGSSLEDVKRALYES